MFLVDPRPTVGIEEETMVKAMHFDGPCSRLMCLADCPHDHPICPKCGAVGYGNICCDECRQNVDINRELAIIEIQAIKAGNSDSD